VHKFGNSEIIHYNGHTYATPSWMDTAESIAKVVIVAIFGAVAIMAALGVAFIAS
jgi:hypothetical protein